MNRLNRTHRAAAIALLAGGLATSGLPAARVTHAATPAVKATINIGTKSFAEEYIISDMYSLLLQKAGFKTKIHALGTETPPLQQAITHGQIDLYPEYTGDGLQLLGITNRSITNNAIRAFDTVSTQYKSKYKLIWLHQSPMNDTNGVAVTKATASKYHLKTLTDLAKVASQLSFGELSGCKTRPDCLAGMQQQYGVHFKSVTDIDSAPVRYKALTSGQIDVAEVFTTDAPIAANHLVVLKDNKQLVFPADHIAPIVRQSILKKYSKIRTVLNKLAPHITNGAMKSLNGKVILQGQDPLAVARAFLKSKHLL